MRDETRTDWHARVDRTIKSLLLQLDSKTGLDTLAASVASSPAHFQKMFTRLAGESPDDCLRRLRMERAAYLLREPGAKVVDVALDSGYDTPEAFAKAFKRAWGLTARQVKKLPWWKGTLPSPAGIHYLAPCNRSEEHWYFAMLEGLDDMQIKIVSLDARRVLGCCVTGDPWNLPHAWASLHPLLRDLDLVKEALSWLSVFHLPGQAGEKRYTAAIQVKDLPQGPACPPDLEEIQLPGGLYAVLVHFGSTEDLGHTVDRWEREWLPRSSWQADPDRPSWEWYQNNQSSPELQLTFWCAPVRPGLQ